MIALLSSLASLAPIGRIGRYDVLGRLAQGGMAEVFLARSSGAAGVARFVVLKRILPAAEKNLDATGAFVTEARLLAKLSHPSLVSIEEFGQDQGKHFLVMEWVRGVSLRRLLEAAKARGGIPWPIAVRIFADLAGALHHAHVAKDERGRPLGVVHRDVTPENVIVSWDGSPKLLDFGIAKSSIDPQKTQMGVLKGKLQYIAPEQYQGLPLDARSDVFALAVCMYEALTSESLYARASEYETVAAIVLDPTVPKVRAVRQHVPEELDAIVGAALAKDRDLRTPTADRVSATLEKLLVDMRQSVRDADVAKYLAQIFPGESGRDPQLDRSPLAGAAGPRRRSASKEMEAMVLGAEADLDADALAASGRGRGRSVLGLMFVALLCAAGLFAWATLRAVEPAGAPPASSAP